MIKLSYSKQVRDFIDAADVSGNIKNNKANKDYLVHIDSAIQTIGRNKFKALYLFVGGNSISHKLNFVDPRDLDAAFRLSFIGTWTHDNTGAINANTTSYINTFLTPSIDLTINNTHIGFYSTNVSSGVIGCRASTSSTIRLTTTAGYVESHMYDVNQGGGGAFAALASASGLTISSRSATNSHSMYYLEKSSNSTSSGGTLPNIPIYINALNDGNTFVSPAIQKLQFATIGSSLTFKEYMLLNSSVKFAQRILGRAV